MNKIIIFLTGFCIIYYLFFYRREPLSNTKNIELDKKIRNLDNKNKGLKFVDKVIEDEPLKYENDDYELRIHPYPKSSQDFIKTLSLNEALKSSKYIDDAYALMIGNLDQNISKEEFKRIQGNVKISNVKNNMKLFKPVFYRFGQNYFDFQNNNNYLIKPNYKISSNYINKN